MQTPHLKSIRKKRLLTLRELHTLSEVGVTTLVRLEAGGNASLSTIRRLCSALKVGPGVLTGQSFDIFDPNDRGES